MMRSVLGRLQRPGQRMIALHNEKPGPAPAFLFESPDFQGKSYGVRKFRLGCWNGFFYGPFPAGQLDSPGFLMEGNLMNKNELVSAVAEAAGLSKGDAQSAVDAVFSVISAS